MHGSQASETLPEGWRESLVCLHLVDEQSVTTGIRHVQGVQECGPRWLVFIGDVAVPGHRVGSVVEELEEGLVFGTAVDEMHFRISLGCSTAMGDQYENRPVLGDVGLPCGVDVKATKVAAKLQSLLDGKGREVLVSECDDLLLGHQQGQLVFALVIELRQLYTSDFGTDRGGDVLDVAAFLQKVLERWVGVFAMFVVLKWFEGSVSDAVMLVSIGRCPALSAISSRKAGAVTYFSPFSLSHTGR